MPRALWLGPFACRFLPPTLTREVFPVAIFRTKMSDTPFVSFLTRLEAVDSKTTTLPLPEISTVALLPLPCLPPDDMLARLVIAAALALDAKETIRIVAMAAAAMERAAGPGRRVVFIFLPFGGRWCRVVVGRLRQSKGMCG